MPVKDPRFPGAVLLTLILAMVLAIIPLGESFAFWRPEWIALTLVHWALVIRDRISLVMVFIIGLVVDTLYGSLLGQHALGYVLVTYLAVRLSLRMTPEAFLQQLALLFVILGLYMLANLWMQRVTGNSSPIGWLYWASLLSSIVIWPVYHSLLGYFHMQRKAL
ncbi:rod shape-determining protein MreD [Thiothrix litoralis]|jgi:rod shape-determining protein MreD|uniref:Rod shape-determining protein MreD n=1 Tax=Thiothrix litoralis TaxID=2891210 RepID=A0ABX7WMP3_9GAMM|nr:rod shape-determining protein MreD [Thiothrix litoralis]QTR45011.1 rod shape-determining protein MreD [Thiothrix litoralis]